MSIQASTVLLLRARTVLGLFVGLFALKPCPQLQSQGPTSLRKKVNVAPPSTQVRPFVLADTG